jgi:hypothetical protein
MTAARAAAAVNHRAEALAAYINAAGTATS